MNHEETIFEQALGIDPGQAREEFLRGECAGNEAMFERLQGLLRAHDRAGKFLEHERPADEVRLSPAFGVPPSGGAASGPAEAGTPNVLTEKPGDRIGRYKLLQKIGEGGCGVVYMAEQEEPVRRRVALKIIKLGMDTRQVIARFEAERQALALMDHPNIAKVFDAGVTERPLTQSLFSGAGSAAASAAPVGALADRNVCSATAPNTARQARALPHNEQISRSGGEGLSAGRPYFVMELVRGVKITEYCDEKKLTTQQRLELFTQVCRAVQHAHQKGIIHRDLKPSNILVSVNDGVAVPKVIDFGIAKATTGEPLTKKTVFTAFEQFIGTPAYMSPEQALVTNVDIDTRSDIYSLGVLLYELLTGQTPFDPKELLKSGLEAMRRTICEREPARPSTRLTDLVAADVRRLTTLSEEDRTSSRRLLQEKERLVSQLRGDLDWIVMKCLEKDRARRYETANGLATDIQRHLNNEPVVACPPSNLYKFQKLVRRNKLAFAAGGGIAAALVIGLALALWQSIEKTRAYNRAAAAEREALANEKKAQTQASRSEQVALFLKDMLEGAGPEVAKGRDATILLEILDKTAERISNELTNQPEVEADLQNTIGSMYRELGQYKKAELILRRALAANKQLHPEGALVVRDSLNKLSAALYSQGSLAESEALSRESLALTRKLLGNEHAYVVSALNDLTANLTFQGKFAEAKVLGQEALALSKKVTGLDDSDVASQLSILADVDRNLGNYAEAEAGFREAVAVLRKAAGADNRDLEMALNGLAIALSDEKKFAEAEVVSREALAMDRRLLGNDHPEVIVNLGNLAAILVDEKKYAEAERLSREALALARKLPAGNEKRVAFLLNALAATLGREKKFAEAEPVAREGLAIARKVLGDDPMLATFVSNLGQFLAAQDKYDEAEPLQREALAIRRKMLGPQHPDIAESLSQLGEVLNKQGKFTEAEDRLREALAMANKFPDNDYANPTNVLAELNKVLAAQGKPSEALPRTAPADGK
jgi:serine/threonine protein kinase/Tfp pilus assembly protein PilF